MNAQPEKQSTKLTKELNRNVCAALDLYCRCKHAHWNVVGANFMGVHELFDACAEHAAGYADTMAEQARYIGAPVDGRASAAAASYLGDYAIEGVASWGRHVQAICTSQMRFLVAIKSAILVSLAAEDQDTADVFIEVARQVANDVYKLRSHLDG